MMRKKTIPEVLVELSGRRSSTRQAIPEVLVELRQNVHSETPDWVKSAVDISDKGMLLELPPEAGPGEFLHMGFTLDDPRASFRGLMAVVIRRAGDLGVLFFKAWPREKQNELAAWLRKQPDQEEPRP